MNQETQAQLFQKSYAANTKTSLFGLDTWEVVVLTLSFLLIVFMAIPNYFGALETMRGQECSRRMMLIANSLKYLAGKNNTQPGKKICEPLELNQALDLTQGALALSGNMVYVPAFFRYGTEPDCADGGDFITTFTLDETGEIIPPVCTKYQGNRVDYFLESGMHFRLCHTRLK